MHRFIVLLFSIAVIASGATLAAAQPAEAPSAREELEQHPVSWWDFGLYRLDQAFRTVERDSFRSVERGESDMWFSYGGMQEDESGLIEIGFDIPTYDPGMLTEEHCRAATREIWIRTFSQLGCSSSPTVILMSDGQCLRSVFLPPFEGESFRRSPVQDTGSLVSHFQLKVSIHLREEGVDPPVATSSCTSHPIDNDFLYNRPEHE